MHLEMTETDHQNLDTLIDNVLNAHKNGELTLAFGGLRRHQHGNRKMAGRDSRRKAGGRRARI